MDKEIKRDLERKNVVTAKELLKKRDLLLSRQQAEHYVDIEAIGVVKFRTPQLDDLIDAQKMASNEDDTLEDIALVEACLVEPKIDQELREAFGVNTNYDFIEKLLNPGELRATTELLMKEAGYAEGKVKKLNNATVNVVNDIKN